MKQARILIADDHEFLRRGLAGILLQGHPEWQIVAEASNGLDAIRLAESLHPDVAILDLSMPGSNGLQVTERLRVSVPLTRTLILTMHTGEQIVRNLRKAGASGYMVKNDASAKLVDAVERVMAGNSFFVSENALNETEPAPSQYLLSSRESQVLKLLVAGKGNKQIASELSISVRTVESHRAKVLSKLGAESLGDLVRIALRDESL